MENKELQNYLAQYPDDMPIKLLHNITDHRSKPYDLDLENILHTSETAYVNKDAPEDEHDTEDGKVELGEGTQYLLINPIIF